MKSLNCISPGHLAYQEIEAPVFDGSQTILRIKRIGICGTDLHAYEGTQPFFNYPRVLGHELAAVIHETNAPGFAKGEPVTIMPYFNCGTCIACRMHKPNCCTQIKVCGVHIDGAMKEYMAVPSYSLVHGAGLGVDELALVEPLAIAAHGVNRAGIRKDEFVLVAGAGPIGLGTMQFAQIAGAKVIAMDINEGRLRFCSNILKVEHVVNPVAENASEKLKAITGGDMPTVVIDATGNLTAINNAFQYLAHGGRYVLIGLQKGEIHFSHPEFHKREATLMSSRNAVKSDFEQVIAAIKAGFVNPVHYITHRVGFDEVQANFESWLNPETGVIKAMVEL